MARTASEADQPTRSLRTWNAAETARETGIPVKSWYTWAAQGALPSYRVGRSRRFHPDDVRKFLESCREGGAQ